MDRTSHSYQLGWVEQGAKHALMQIEDLASGADPETRQRLEDIARDLRRTLSVVPDALHRCASPNCPGYPWRASDRPHPCPPGVSPHG